MCVGGRLGGGRARVTWIDWVVRTDGACWVAATWGKGTDVGLIAA